MKGFRHCDSRFPFLWDGVRQSAARWHDAGEGPVNYFSDTPVGAWAEFLRHEGIKDPQDLQGVRRSLWVVELPDDGYVTPELPNGVMQGDRRSYAACRAEAQRLRKQGVLRLRAPCAALIAGGASGWTAISQIEHALPARDGWVWILFGSARALIGWPAIEAGAPAERILPLVNHF